MSVNPVFPAVFEGGQMTDLPVFSGSLNGTELMEVVAAPTGQTNEAAGVNYQITTALLGALLSQLGFSSVIITDGQYTTPGAPYVVPPLIARVYINKTLSEPTYITFGLASTYSVEPLVKDIAGTSGAGAVTTVSFSGGEDVDNYTSVPIASPFGGYFFRPISSLGTWTLGSA